MAKKITIISLALLLLLALKPETSAQVSLTSQQVDAEQAELQKQLDDIENKIGVLQKDLKKIGSQKKTLQNKIVQLQKEQAVMALKIDSTNLQVLYIDGQISKAELDIVDTNERLSALREQISSVLRLIYRTDRYSILYQFIVSKNFSDVFIELDNYYKIVGGLNEILEEVKALNEHLEVTKNNLVLQQDNKRSLLDIQHLQKVDLADSESEQKVVLKETKGKESNYQANLSDAKKQAQAIRSRIYQLLEVEKQINFGQAVSIAEWAGGQTGVRAALLLSVLTQESNLGRNVGTCNRAGDPATKSWKVVMHPTRDQPYFKTITSELGMNIDTTPISCPMRDAKGGQVGWGGAMGPAQFIPSTWMGYRGKVTAITGKPANPWDIRDAFLASALKLGHDGATTRDGEWAAAMRYFSGSTNVRFRFYGDSVVARADKYQADIDQMKKGE